MDSSPSYVHGDSGPALIGDTIGVFFDKAVARFAEREALVSVHQGIRWTYRELQRRVNNLAAGLLRLGLRPGDRIGIWSQNNAEWTLTQFATARLGLILVNINPAYRGAELEYALNLVGCRALVLSPSFKSSDYLAMLRELAPELAHAAPGQLRAARLPALEIVIGLGAPAPGLFEFQALLADASAAELEALRQLGDSLQFDDPINIQFTSGTTGAPKGATLTHHNILNNAFIGAQTLRFTENDRLCLTLPLYHCFAMVLGNLLCLSHGAALVYPHESFDAARVLAAIEQERCTALHGVPTMFIGLLEHPAFARTDLSSLRTGIMGGAPCPVEIMKRVIDDMHLRDITIAFGMTETSPASFQTAVDDTLERRVGSVGRVLPHLEAKVVDGDGRVVPRGVTGEVCIRGYAVMRGYWGAPEKTAEVIDSARWLHTGDLGVIDEHGYCRIVGRLKDLAIRGGENVYPREVEEFLFRHPKIEQVAVFGVPDEKYGEEICAWIKLREGCQASVEEIHAFCCGQIAHYKIPRHVRFVEQFPLTATGKIQKFVMREHMLLELGPDLR